MRNLTERFLEGLAGAIDSLNVGSSPTSLNPRMTLLSALILTGTAAFSYGFKLPLLILTVSVGLILLTRSPIRVWARIPLLVSVWAFLASVPLPFMTPGETVYRLSLGLIDLEVSREGLNSMLTFISRVVAAAAIFTSLAFIMGWKRIVKGLGDLRIPQELGFLLNLSIVHIPLFLRETVKMLSARESRVMRKIRFREVWRVLSTVVGDLLLRSYERAWMVDKAIRARSFASTGFPWKTPSAAVGIKDFLLLSFSLCMVAFGVLTGG